MQPTIIPQYIMPDNVRTVNFLSSIFVSKFNDAAKLAILTQNCNMQLQRTVILWYHKRTTSPPEVALLQTYSTCVFVYVGIFH